MKKLLLKINGAKGYSSEQVSSISLGVLKDMVEEYIEYYGADTEIVTYDESNRYGASYGIILDITEEKDEDYE